MAVIAKMTISEVKRFDKNLQVNLSCVYDGTLANAENEDVRFTKASPYGNASVTIEEGPVLPNWEEKVEGRWLMPKSVYILFHAKGDVPSFDGCIFALEAVCHTIIDQGYTKQVEMCGAYTMPEDLPIPVEKRIGKKSQTFTLKMGIDNANAVVQFRPTSTYWLTFYEAEKYTLDEVLALARA